LVAALAIVALIGVAVWGLSEDEASRCEPVPAWFLRELEHGLRSGGFGPTAEALGDSAAVPSDSFEGPLARAENAWFVSVDVRPKPGIKTSLIQDELFRTGYPLSPAAERSGAGFITGAGPEPSAWRPGSAKARTLDFYGISPDSDGLMESVKCVEEGLP
jgi:hypothetical protein